ncbi:MAG: Asp23/Gls24 family envelope stress response protein [Halanaerobium sp.]|nr:Asp23/Gls24 family envelope stress response protein [Halanaerobium sp.]
MEVYALVGTSGTGKSHRAGIVAHDYNIPLIIDDGLLIRHGKLLAGKSAKREDTKIAAVRTALFSDKGHRQEVRQAIKLAGEDSILVLGTSVKMVERIVETLGLPEISTMINIEDITTEEDIQRARRIREREGKHVIPVPTIEVKSRFLGYFINPLQLLFNKGEETIKQEKTIVRPKFSYYGNLIIYNNVIVELLEDHLKGYQEVKQFKGIRVDKNKEGLKILFKLVLSYGLNIPEYVRGLQNSLQEHLEKLTGIIVLRIDVEVSSLVVEE